MVSLNENIAGVWELHPVVKRSTLRRSVVNFQGTSFDSAATLQPPLSDVAPTGTKREDCGARLMATTSLLSGSKHLGTRGQQRLFPSRHQGSQAIERSPSTPIAASPSRYATRNMGTSKGAP